MKIGPLFKWFGSKWQAARRYPAPECSTIVEPFAGGAGFSLNYCDRQVRLYDTDPHLAALWPWLIDQATEDLIREIPVGVPEGSDIRQIGLTPGQELLLKTWQRTNNVGNCWTISAWGSKPGQWTANTRSRVAEQVAAVKHWTFARVDFPLHSTVYVDPPYLYNYRYNQKGFNYRYLARWVETLDRSNQVIVCEAACPKTGAIPDWLPFRPSHASVTSRRKVDQSHHSKELIWTKEKK